MNNRQYTNNVENFNYPEDPFVPVDSFFKDERGLIENLLHTPINSIAKIVSEKGAVRANHYHKTDFHYTYVISGSVEYWEKDLAGKESPTKKVFKTGDLFFTPPNRLHKMVFLEKTEMFTFAKNLKDHEHYEDDVVRVDFDGV